MLIKKLTLILFSLILISGCSEKKIVAKPPRQQAMPLHMVATVNDVVIAKDSFDKRMAQTQSLASRKSPEAVMEDVLGELIDLELIAQEALKDKTNLTEGEKLTRKASLAEELAKSKREKIQAEVSVKPSEVRKVMKDNQGEQGIRLMQIVLGSQAKAQDVLHILQRGSDFISVAEKASMESDPDLGVIKRGQLDPAIEEAAFALQDGEISSVIKTGLAFYILKRTSLTEEYLTKELRRKKEEEAWQNWINKLRNQAEIVINNNLFG